MASTRSSSDEGLVALREFIHRPEMVGSAFPASIRLVKRMLAPLEFANIDVFVEFGPGTGRFTLAALSRMKPGAQLIAIETGEGFVEALRKTTDDPRLSVVHGSAADVTDILGRYGLRHADCILSGLPFSTIGETEAASIIRSSCSVLRPTGTFAAYQMRTAIEPLLRASFPECRESFEWWNIPPCHLYWAEPRRRPDSSEPLPG